MKDKKDKLSFRERKFIKYLSQGMTQKDAAILAGYSRKSADSLASQTLKNPKVQRAFAQILESHGVTDEKLSSTIAEGLEATKVISCNVIVPNAEGMKDANSMTRDFVDVPDWIARHRFTDTAIKVKGGYLAEKHEVTGPDGGPVRFSDVEPATRIQYLLSRTAERVQKDKSGS